MSETFNAVCDKCGLITRVTWYPEIELGLCKKCKREYDNG